MLKQIAEKIYNNREVILGKIMASLEENFPSFSSLLSEAKKELWDSLETLIVMIAKFVEGEAENPRETLAFVKGVSEARFVQNVPFSDLIRSFYIGDAIIWDEVVKGFWEGDYAKEDWIRLFAIKGDLESHLITYMSEAYIKDRDKMIARQIRELASLVDVGKTISSTIDMDRLLQQILDVSTSLMEVKMGAVFLLNRETGEMRMEASTGLSRPWSKGYLMDLERSLLKKALEEKRPKVAVDEELKGIYLPVLPGERRIRSLLSCPIFIGDEPLGSIELYDEEPRTYEPIDLAVLATFALQSGVAIRNAQLFHAERRRRYQALLSKELAEDVSMSINYYQALGVVAHKLAEVAGVDRCSIFSYDPEKGEIQFLRGLGLTSRERKILKSRRWRPEEIDEMDRIAVQDKQIVVIQDAATDPRINPANVKAFNIRSCLLVPLVYRGQVKGLVYLDHTKRKHVFDQDEVDMIKTIAGQAAVALEHMKLRESVHQKELRLREAEVNEELYKERERSEAIINASPDAIALVDRNFNIVSFNPAAEKLTGWKASDAIGRSCHEVFYGRPYSPEECEAIDCPIAKAFRGEISPLKERLYTRKDGSQTWIGGSFSVLRNPKRRIENVIAVFRDITEEKRLEDAALTDRELQVAREAQRSLLPEDILESERVKIKAQLHQARLVGGDWYDYWIDDSRLVLVIGDAAGSGMPAALKATVAMSALRAVAGISSNIMETIRMVNKAVLPSKLDDSFITLFYGELDLDSLVFRYVNAGHNDPIWIRKGKSSLFLPCEHRFILGAFEETELGVEEVQMEAGDRLLLYTDGLVESRNSHRVPFGINRLIRYVNANSSRTREALVEGLFNRLLDFTAGKLDDDVTLIICDII